MCIVQTLEQTMTRVIALAPLHITRTCFLTQVFVRLSARTLYRGLTLVMNVWTM